MFPLNKYKQLSKKSALFLVHMLLTVSSRKSKNEKEGDIYQRNIKMANGRVMSSIESAVRLLKDGQTVALFRENKEQPFGLLLCRGY